MFIPFENLSAQSRLWVYQANRLLTAHEIELLKGKLQHFTQHWEAHQQPLQASFEILHQQFVLVSVDEQRQQATGCSIDKSVALMKEMSDLLQIDFFDRLTICYQIGQNIRTVNLATLKQEIANGGILPATLVFDNTIQQKQQLENQWLRPANQTWLKKYFIQETVCL